MRKLRRRFFNKTIFWLLLPFISICMALPKEIPIELFEQAKTTRAISFHTMISMWSHVFLGQPYGSLSYPERQLPKSIEDLLVIALKDEFRYDFNSFDCVTYIETVFALALATSELNFYDFSASDFNRKFAYWLRRIRYNSSHSNFLSRNHFPGSQWLPNNQWLWRDVTTELGVKTKLARCDIELENWLWSKKPYADFLKNRSKEQHSTLKKVFRAGLKQQHFELTERDVSVVPYIPTIEIVEHLETWVEKFPSVAIVSIVRPNWDLRRYIGTRLNISHHGIALKDGHRIWFLHPTSEDSKQVVKLTLQSYMRQFVDNLTVKGINVQAVHPHPIFTSD